MTKPRFGKQRTVEGPYAKNDVKTTEDRRIDSSGNFKEKPKSWADVLDPPGKNSGLSDKLPRKG